MCDCNLPATPEYSRPSILMYSPPAIWDPRYDPDRREVGGIPLILIPDDFKHKNNLLEPPAPIGSAAEFEQLFEYKKSERDRNCAKICDQNFASMGSLFGNLMNSTGKPWTRLLIGSAESDVMQIGLFQKKLPNFNRARPYQVHPDLAPPFTPGHPSYPGGHAAQSRAVADVIALILQSPDNAYAALIKQCDELAADVARNRELAGVHYPSDTDAGRRLADIYMEEAKKSDKFVDQLSKARGEWK